jgi:ketosteroid isomerase-like protein
MKNLKFSALALVLAACAPGQLRPDADIPAERLRTSGYAGDRGAILDLRADHNRAISTGDTEGFLRIAADDYVAIFGGGRIIRSKDELRRIWTERPQQCVRTPLRIEVATVDGGTRAAENGKWRCDSRSPAAVYTGSYFAHWSKRSGEWRVVSDTYVTLACRGSGCS